MNKYKIISFCCFVSFFCSNLLAQEESLDATSKVISLEEITITSSRENRVFKEQPVSYTYISSKEIENTNINTLHDVSVTVPNFYMPDYGSKITSSIYVRGIGSRMNEPSVGLYIDDVPYLDKSSFDFDFYDIEHIDFLRGPQGTLYGRNTIGGLINIKTLSPFDYQGTKVFASYGNANDQLYRLSHYQKIHDKFGLSLAGYYHSNDGFFTNQFNGKKDDMQSFGGRFKFDWKLSSKWSMDISAVYDQVSQDAYPYAAYNKETEEVGDINYNEEGSYKRQLFAGGLKFQRKSNKLLFTSATSYQYLDDQMKIDQDFTADSIYALTQNQIQQSITQEFVFRSRGNSKYQWVNGAFGFYKESDVNAPMLFRSGGLAMIQTYLDNAKAANPRMPAITITNTEMPVAGKFNIPDYGAALYHQSAYTFFDKLTLTAGLRLEYEKTDIDYDTYATLHTDVKVSPSPMVPVIKKDSTYSINGHISQDFWQLLPKVAIKYDFNRQYNIYASVAKGAKAGGYNFQMFSEILSDMMQGKQAGDAKDVIAYEPETTINYEIGTHSEIIESKLFVDLALFYIDYTNQQIVSFASTNIGSRMMENAGRSESWGAEASVRYRILDNLSAQVNYGFTNATFKEYDNGQKNYAGNYVPLVPQNTFSVGADYRLKINWKYLDFIVFRAQYNGAGKIYFTEDNDVSQNFYGLLNGSISLEKGKFSLNGWIKNALSEEYNVFYFTSLNNSFVQQGKPRQFGVSAQFRF